MIALIIILTLLFIVASISPLLVTDDVQDIVMMGSHDTHAACTD